ncbi:hydrophobin [Boletus coccyginus]|nr:hydrophobin [Boletus coccyginus]
MYTRFSTLLSVAALVAVTAAAPSVLEARDGDAQCVKQCCASTETATPARLTELRGQLGLALPDVDGLIALNCVPITETGTGGATCAQKPVCCTKNDFNGEVNLGCKPFDLN